MADFNFIAQVFFNPDTTVPAEQTTLQTQIDDWHAAGHTTPTITPSTFQTDPESGEHFITRPFSSLEAALNYVNYCNENCSNFIRAAAFELGKWEDRAIIVKT